MKIKSMQLQVYLSSKKIPIKNNTQGAIGESLPNPNFLATSNPTYDKTISAPAITIKAIPKELSIFPLNYYGA